MANALTALRLLLAVPFALFMARGDMRSAIFALVAWTVALATDLLDGPIARKGTATSSSGAFDHVTDFLFVTSGLLAGALRGAFPLILPVLVTAAFVQYVLGSYWDSYRADRRGRLCENKLGRYNGVLYFVPACMDILIRLGVWFVRPLLTALVWALVLSTLVSMGQRLVLRRLPEEFPSSPPKK